MTDKSPNGSEPQTAGTRCAFEIRRLTSADIPDGMRLKNAEGWNQVEADWQLYLELAPAGCIAAVRGGLVAGTGVAVSYDCRLAWIGMILVDTASRRLGVATTVMRELLQALAPDMTAKLDASPVGQPVYEKLGFVAECGLTRMACPAVPSLLNSVSSVRPLDVPQLAWAAEKDAVAFGVARASLLSRLLARTPEAAWCMPEGFCMGRAGWHSFQIGPVIATHFEAARTVVAAALGRLHGRVVILDVPDAQHDMQEWLASLGFVQLRRYVRMVRGANVTGESERYFAATGPEFG